MSMYIYMDESGDLGFSEGSSRWFIFTLALSSDKRALERAVKKVWTPLKRKHKKLGELHANRADPITRRRLLQKIVSTDDVKVMCVVLNKEKVHINFQSQKDLLYNYTANMLLERLHQKGVTNGDTDIELCIDRKDTKKSLTENFTKYLLQAVAERGGQPFTISLLKSHESKSIQAVDFISWAIFRKYEQGEYEYYSIVEDIIVDEKLLFP